LSSVYLPKRSSPADPSISRVYLAGSNNATLVTLGSNWQRVKEKILSKYISTRLQIYCKKMRLQPSSVGERLGSKSIAMHQLSAILRALFKIHFVLNF